MVAVGLGIGILNWRGSLEPPVCSCSEAQVTTWVWDWHLKCMCVGEGQSCGTEPLTCGIWYYLWVDSIRTELNYRTPSWCQDLLVGVGNPLPCMDWNWDLNNFRCVSLILSSGSTSSRKSALISQDELCGLHSIPTVIFEIQKLPPLLQGSLPLFFPWPCVWLVPSHLSDFKSYILCKERLVLAMVLGQQILTCRCVSRKSIGNTLGIIPVKGVKEAWLDRGRSWAVMQSQQKPQPISLGVLELGWPFGIVLYWDKEDGPLHCISQAPDAGCFWAGVVMWVGQLPSAEDSS